MVFKKFQGFYKKWFWINDFTLFIYIKNIQLIFPISKKKYLYLLYQNNLLQNFDLCTKIILLTFTKNEWIFTILFTKEFQFVFI